MQLVKSFRLSRFFSLIFGSGTDIRSFTMTSKVKIGGETFKYEDTLPSLPVPPLKLTCQKYLESVKPCVSDEQFLITKNKVEQFCEGVGPVLQEKLEKRAATTKNWLEPLWEEQAYMKPRYPIAPLINPSGPIFALEDISIWPAEYTSRVSRTAVLLHFFMHEWNLLYTQKREVDRKGSSILSMFQYRRWTSWCRIPGKTIDTYIEEFKPAPAPAVNYVIVLINGRIYKCVVLNENLDPLSVHEIEMQLQCIENDAFNKPSGPGIGSLTSEYRPVWADAREHLLALSPKHNEMIDEIQKSLIVVCFDDESPSSMDECNSLLMGGDCRNRWFDKSFQLIAFKNGVFGVNFDHLAYDGIVEIMVVFRTTDNVEEYLKKKHKQEKASDDVYEQISKACELDFYVDNHLMKAVESATKQFQMLASNMGLKTLSFNFYGKNFIKKVKLHPDTYIQMAILLADYKLHKRVAPTYETASTRTFYHGRTDTMRTLTTEAQNWCKMMENSQVTVAEKAKLLRTACQKHDELMMEAQNGLGIDRHLLGLKVVAEESGLPIPDIYTDEAWTKSGGDANFALSTSLVGYRPVYGFTAPMVEDGYGAYYSIENERINIMTTTFRSSKVTDCFRYSSSLQQSLLDMQRILVGSKL